MLRVWMRWMPVVMMALVIGLLADGAFAQELKPITNVTQKILDEMTGGLALVLCALAIAGLGYSYWTGRISGEYALAIGLGTGLVFGAANIAKLLSEAAKVAS